MDPFIRGHDVHIPIHLSFAAQELVNSPENLNKDLQKATKPDS